MSNKGIKGQRWGGRKDKELWVKERRIKRLNCMLTLISGLVCGWRNAGVNGLKKELPWIRGYQDSCSGGWALGGGRSKFNGFGAIKPWSSMLIAPCIVEQALWKSADWEVALVPFSDYVASFYSIRTSFSNFSVICELPISPKKSLLLLKLFSGTFCKQEAWQVQILEHWSIRRCILGQYMWELWAPWMRLEWRTMEVPLRFGVYVASRAHGAQLRVCWWSLSVWDKTHIKSKIWWTESFHALGCDEDSQNLETIGWGCVSSWCLMKGDVHSNRKVLTKGLLD